MDLANLTPQQLRKAADLQEKIQSLQRELGLLLGEPSGPSANGTKRRTLTAAGRAAIAAAAKARWAKVRGSEKGSSAAKPGRRIISAAGRARLAAIARERWKKAKAAGRAAL